MKQRGIVAAGHGGTADAARELLLDGGNAFDAILGALAAACAAEPLLSSLGGGGFLLAHRADSSPIVYDFFAQTPHSRNTENPNFYPIHGDFGGVTQEFHIGTASIAVPGVVRGLFSAHRDLCTLPMTRIFEPAVRLARTGSHHNECQAYIERILAPILQSTEAMRRLFPEDRSVFRNPELADFFEVLGREGEDFFYRGEPARRIASDCADGGGHLTEKDFHDYRVWKRPPLEYRHGSASILMNPPPSSGGILIALTLALLDTGGQPGDALELVRAQRLTNDARQQAIEGRLNLDRILESDGSLKSALAALGHHRHGLPLLHLAFAA